LARTATALVAWRRWRRPCLVPFAAPPQLRGHRLLQTCDTDLERGCPSALNLWIGRVQASRAFPKFESYGMLETAASVGWKVKDAIVRFHGIGRLAASTSARPGQMLRALLFRTESQNTLRQACFQGAGGRPVLLVLCVGLSAPILLCVPQRGAVACLFSAFTILSSAWSQRRYMWWSTSSNQTAASHLR